MRTSTRLVSSRRFVWEGSPFCFAATPRPYAVFQTVCMDFSEVFVGHSALIGFANLGGHVCVAAWTQWHFITKNHTFLKRGCYAVAEKAAS